MQEKLPMQIMDGATSAALSIKAAEAFRPRAPISTRQLFAGRWEQMTTLADAVSQAGLHIVVFGERGVGKTSLSNVVAPVLTVMEESANTTSTPRLVYKVNTHQGDGFHDVWLRVVNDVSWVQNRAAIGIRPELIPNRVTLKSAFAVSDRPSIDEVRRLLSMLPRSVLIFDEFDRGSAGLKTNFTDLIKSLSDYDIDSTIVLVGVAETVDQLIQDHASIVRSVVQIQVPRMKENELADILENGTKILGVRFSKEASALIVRMSQGLPHYTHLIGLHSSREAIRRLSFLVELQDVHRSFQKAVKQAVQSIQEKYLKAIHSARKDALYNKAILACAAAASSTGDAAGYFHPADVIKPLSSILDRRNVTIATFQKHINEFCERERGPVLERAGMSRAYKYRFQEPLLPPYIFMTSLAENDITAARLQAITAPS